LTQVGTVRIQDNEFENIQSSSATAIAVFTGTGLVIAGNTIHNATKGMDLTTMRHSRISGNIISACGTFGIQIDANGSDNLIADNLIAGTTAGPGLQVFGDRNEIRGNLLNTSSGFGLFFNGGAENNHYRDNTARANCQGACSCAVGTPTDFCDANLLNMNTDGGGNALP
jgi:nitrous oxidase accessory protein NosD